MPTGVDLFIYLFYLSKDDSRHGIVLWDLLGFS